MPPGGQSISEWNRGNATGPDQLGYRPAAGYTFRNGFWYGGQNNQRISGNPPSEATAAENRQRAEQSKSEATLRREQDNARYREQAEAAKARATSARQVSEAETIYDRATDRYEESRDIVQGLLDSQPDTSATALSTAAQILTPTPDAETQVTIDYAVSLVSNPDSALRRMIDGNFDFTYFNQGVVQPLSDAHSDAMDDVMSSFSGGDPYGRQGGMASGASRAAVAKGKRELSDTIAGLRSQEYNNMLSRSLEASNTLTGLMGTIDNRPYAQAGLDAALRAAGLSTDAWNVAMGAATSMSGQDANLAGGAMSGYNAALGQATDVDVAGADRTANMGMQFSGQLQSMLSGFGNNQTTLDASNLDIRSRDWTTLLERDFAWNQAEQQKGLVSSLGAMTRSAMNRGPRPAASYLDGGSLYGNRTPAGSSTGPRTSTNSRKYAMPTVQ